MGTEIYIFYETTCSLHLKTSPDLIGMVQKYFMWKTFFFFQFSSVQSFSHARLFVTPWTAACQASLSITNSQSLLKLTSIESVMPSNSLILGRPLLLLPSIFPSTGSFPVSQFFASGGQSIGASVSVLVLFSIRSRKSHLTSLLWRKKPLIFYWGKSLFPTKHLFCLVVPNARYQPPPLPQPIHQ